MIRYGVAVGSALLCVWSGTSAGYDRPDTIDRWDGNAFYTFAFDSDIASMDLKGDPDNVVRVIDVNAMLGTPSGTPVTVHGFSYAVTIEALAPTALNALFLDMRPALPGGTDVLFFPGFNHAGPGVLNKAGSADFSALGIDEIVLTDGMLRLEFFTDPNAAPDAPDGYWRGGDGRHITFDVTVIPAPGGAVTLALAGFSAVRRRARR